MANTTPQIGSKVERIAKDYTGGRTGEVIEIKENRARVKWTADKGGAPMNLRTWVRFQDLKVLAPSASEPELTEADFKAWIDAKKAQRKEWIAQGERGELKDDANPAYLFSTTWTELLVRIVSGEVSATFMASMELANRGLDKQGKWVGFDQADKIHFS